MFSKRNFDISNVIGSFVNNNKIEFFTSFCTVIWIFFISKRKFNWPFNLFKSFDSVNNESSSSSISSFNIFLLLFDGVKSFFCFWLSSFFFFFNIILSNNKNISWSIICKTSLLNLFQANLQVSINKENFLVFEFIVL